MGCVLTIIALLVPRLTMFFIWLLTDWFSQAFETVVWPLLGFFFMPYTTLACMAAVLRNGSVSGWWIALVVLAVLVDIGHWGGGGSSYRRR
ncbi:MAG: hypothetical protein PVJ27_08880 [Candidatus Brocadiaceae bacterium]|jgi:hypothetical protein